MAVCSAPSGPRRRPQGPRRPGRRHWGRVGVPVALAVTVALALSGCGESSTGSGSSPAAVVTRITIHYANGQISPPPSQVPVAVGTRVVITVTSDVAEQVHNHYNDKEINIPAGGTAVFDFVVTLPGVYEVELHQANKVLMRLQVG